MKKMVQGKKNAYIARFDKGNKADLIHSTYIWSPDPYEF